MPDSARNVHHEAPAASPACFRKGRGAVCCSTHRPAGNRRSWTSDQTSLGMHDRLDRRGRSSGAGVSHEGRVERAGFLTSSGVRLGRSLGRLKMPRLDRPSARPEDGAEPDRQAISRDRREVRGGNPDHEGRSRPRGRQIHEVQASRDVSAPGVVDLNERARCADLVKARGARLIPIVVNILTRVEVDAADGPAGDAPERPRCRERVVRLEGIGRDGRVGDGGSGGAGRGGSGRAAMERQGCYSAARPRGDTRRR